MTSNEEVSVKTETHNQQSVEINDLQGHFLVDTKAPGDGPTPCDGALLCKICSKKYCNPRLLSCLHVFCQNCLDELLSSSQSKNTILCPDCLQESKVGNSGAASLPRDFVMTNIVELSKIESATLMCSSCSSDLIAIASCHDCAEYLCAACHSAHVSMRCFSGHKVVQFSEGTDGSETNAAICKPIFCDFHPTEKFTFYCHNCQVLICNECVVSQHQTHRLCTGLEEVVSVHKSVLEKLVQSTEAKRLELQEVTALLDEAHSELNFKHDLAKEALLAKYNEYKANLEKRKEEGLQQLEELRLQQESLLTDIRRSKEQTDKKVEGACKFTSQLMKHGNTVEILSLKKLVKTQLRNILKYSKPIIRVNVDFEAKLSLFENAVKEDEKPKKGVKTAPKAKKAPVKKAAVKKTKISYSCSCSEESDVEDFSSSEEEPPNKKANTPPSDTDIKKCVKKFLEGADLQQITMKTVCEQVFKHYPGHDLSLKKNMIKDAVKSIISSSSSSRSSPMDD